MFYKMCSGILYSTRCGLVFDYSFISYSNFRGFQICSHSVNVSCTSSFLTSMSHISFPCPITLARHASIVSGRGENRHFCLILNKDKMLIYYY